MKLSNEAVNEFQEIFESEYGKKLSYGEAEEEAQRLLTLMSVIARK